mmetsp:Transcript_11107/g.20105  ORF Transcript_11107/g.20105 Transcript_11107/m.20105 type:complete len:319 (-) Transcript_11107:169-1125(-)
MGCKRFLDEDDEDTRIEPNSLEYAKKTCLEAHSNIDQVGNDSPFPPNDWKYRQSLLNCDDVSSLILSSYAFSPMDYRIDPYIIRCFTELDTICRVGFPTLPGARLKGYHTISKASPDLAWSRFVSTQLHNLPSSRHASSQLTSHHRCPHRIYPFQSCSNPSRTCCASSSSTFFPTYHMGEDIQQAGLKILSSLPSTSTSSTSNPDPEYGISKGPPHARILRFLLERTLAVFNVEARIVKFSLAQPPPWTRTWIDRWRWGNGSSESHSTVFEIFVLYVYPVGKATADKFYRLYGREGEMSSQGALMIFVPNFGALDWAV